jgi:endonuclease/exonuclease/phosphatase family metal-dependent hydrolase
VLRDYWDALVPIIRGAADRRIVFLGDLNADPEKPSQVGGQRLAQLRSEGWHIPTAVGAWSFKSGSRIDHALASAQLTMPSATYVAELDGLRLAGGEPGALSDHAALVVDLPPGAP